MNILVIELAKLNVIIFFLPKINYLEKQGLILTMLITIPKKYQNVF